MTKKQINFDSIAEGTHEETHQDEDREQGAAKSKPVSGQVTGKFRSLNESAMAHLVVQMQKKTATKQQKVVFSNPKHLQTDDDYCETLTASSEESPLRQSKLVERAAKQTTKEYL